jgi:hypothetical protein
MRWVRDKIGEEEVRDWSQEFGKFEHLPRHYMEKRGISSQW